MVATIIRSPLAAIVYASGDLVATTTWLMVWDDTAEAHNDMMLSSG